MKAKCLKSIDQATSSAFPQIFSGRTTLATLAFPTRVMTTLTASEAACEGSSALLGQVLPLLLIGEHLPPGDRVAFFGITVVTAQAMLRHAPCTNLVLKLGGANARSTPATAMRAQQLAAQSSSVALALHGGLITPAECLHQSITSIHLDGVQLSWQDLRSQLQLHKLPHLHTLSLQACRFTPGHGAVIQGTGTASSVRTLKCMSCTSSTSLFSNALSLVDPGQLQTLITNDIAAPAIVAQLPALQELQLLSNTALVDSSFQQLLQHPRLTRVLLPSLNLQQDYSAHPCSWTSFTLTAWGARYMPGLDLAKALPWDSMGHHLRTLHLGRYPLADTLLDLLLARTPALDSLQVRHIQLQTDAHAAEQHQWRRLVVTGRVAISSLPRLPLVPGMELVFGDGCTLQCDVTAADPRLHGVRLGVRGRKINIDAPHHVAGSEFPAQQSSELRVGLSLLRRMQRDGATGGGPAIINLKMWDMTSEVVLELAGLPGMGWTVLDLTESEWEPEPQSYSTLLGLLPPCFTTVRLTCCPPKPFEDPEAHDLTTKQVEEICLACPPGRSVVVELGECGPEAAEAIQRKVRDTLPLSRVVITAQPLPAY